MTYIHRPFRFKTHVDDFSPLFKLLQISPSYELARRYVAGERSKRFMHQLPSDFSKVLEVYKKFGDVMRIEEGIWIDR